MKRILFVLGLLALNLSAFAQAEFVKKLAAGQPQTLVVYGTSVSSLGHGLEWVAAVGEDLNRRYDNRLTLHNNGMSGRNSEWALKHVQDSVIAVKPDAVIIEFATNDAVTRFNISLEDCRNNTIELINTIRKACPDCEIILHTVCGYPLGKNLENRPQMDKYNAVYRKISKEQKLMLIDEAEIFKGIARKQGVSALKRFQHDGVHSTQRGALEIIYPNVVRTLTGDKSVHVNEKGE